MWNLLLLYLYFHINKEKSFGKHCRKLGKKLKTELNVIVCVCFSFWFDCLKALCICRLLWKRQWIIQCVEFLNQLSKYLFLWKRCASCRWLECVLWMWRFLAFLKMKIRNVYKVKRKATEYLSCVCVEVIFKLLLCRLCLDITWY